jgi:hypothetical protein
MPQNLRTIVRTARGWLGIVAAGVVTVAAVLVPAPAFAAPAAGSPSSVLAGSSGTVTGRMPGTKILCTSYWTGAGDNNAGYTEVEWTSNPCGYAIQERTWCIYMGGSGLWENSGIVFGDNIWDKSSCANFSYASRGEVHFNYQDGNGWTKYQTFWTA